MHAHEHVVLVLDLALHHRHVVLLVDQRAEADHVELAERGGQPRLHHPLDELVVQPAVGDQVGDRDHLELVLAAVLDEVVHPRHRAVVVHHLADHARRREPRQAGQVDGGLGLPGALEHPALLGLQREDVAGLDEVTGAGGRVDRGLDRAGTVVGGDAGGDALAGLDRDGERRLERATRSWPPSGRGRARRSGSGVRARQISPRPCMAMKLMASGVANWAARVRSPSFSRSSASQTTTILPGADVLDRVLDGAEGRVAHAVRPTSIFSTYLAITSTSTFTWRPGLD